VNQQVAVIGQYPFGLVVPLQAVRQLPGLLLDAQADFVRDGLDLPLVRARTDDEVVGEGGDPRQIEDLDIRRFLGFSRARCNQPRRGSGGCIGGNVQVSLRQNTLLWVSYYRGRSWRTAAVRG